MLKIFQHLKMSIYQIVNILKKETFIIFTTTERKEAFTIIEQIREDYTLKNKDGLLNLVQVPMGKSKVSLTNNVLLSYDLEKEKYKLLLEMQQQLPEELAEDISFLTLKPKEYDIKKGIAQKSHIYLEDIPLDQQKYYIDRLYRILETTPKEYKFDFNDVLIYNEVESIIPKLMEKGKIKYGVRGESDVRSKIPQLFIDNAIKNGSVELLRYFYDTYEDTDYTEDFLLALKYDFIEIAKIILEKFNHEDDENNELFEKLIKHVIKSKNQKFIKLVLDHAEKVGLRGPVLFAIMNDRDIKELDFLVNYYGEKKINIIEQILSSSASHDFEEIFDHFLSYATLEDLQNLNSAILGDEIGAFTEEQELKYTNKIALEIEKRM